jgi:hypothetical protein
MRGARGQVSTITAPENKVRTTAVSAEVLAGYEAEIQELLKKVRTLRTAMEVTGSEPVRADGAKQWRTGIELLTTHVNRAIVAFRKANYARV